ncbi:MAG: cysteinyl-tRNA synthetase, partial [Candidatus Omnitrophota bacterium]
VFAKSLKEATVKITDALNDDFNTPVMMASIFDIVRQFNEGYKPGKEANPVLNFKATAFKEWLRDIGKLSALFQENAAAFLKSLDTILIREKNIDVALVEQLIKDRNQARADKDFTKADEYRDALVELDILLQDTADGTIWEVKKT